MLGDQQGRGRKFPALMSFSHLYSNIYINTRTDRPVPTANPGPGSVLVDQYGYILNFSLYKCGENPQKY
jgi:hypothetical protein